MTDTLTRTMYRVRFSEVKKNLLVTPAQILYYFQDSNIFQHEDYGIGLDYLETAHKAWFCSSWQVDIKRYPKLGEQLNVGTWDAKYDGIYSHRNCELLDSNNERIATANCICIYMNLEKNRPEKITNEIADSYYHAAPLDMKIAPRKITVPDTYREEEPFEIMQYHIDFNGHVNNGKYVEIAQAYLPESPMVSKVRADYRQSACLHDIFYPRVSQIDAFHYVIQFCNEKGKPYAVMEFTLDDSFH